MRKYAVLLLFFATLGLCFWLVLGDSASRGTEIGPSFSAGDGKQTVDRSNNARSSSKIAKGFETPQRVSSKTVELRGGERQKLIESLPVLASTYDRDALEKVKGYAFSADVEVRGVAIDAIVAIGIPEGAEVLEEVLKSLTVPEEIIDVKEKIRFLRLPPAVK